MRLTRFPLPYITAFLCTAGTILALSGLALVEWAGAALILAGLMLPVHTPGWLRDE